jgi:tetratricopeptide (TPR) repeat protein
MRRIFIGSILLAIAAPAYADPAVQRIMASGPDAADLTKAKVAILASKPNDALALLDPLVTRMEAEAAKHKERLYSGQTYVQTMTYLLMAAKDHVGAIDVGPTLAEANFWKGFVLVDIGRSSEAKPLFERAVALAPDNSQFLCEFAAWQAQRKQTDMAFSLYQRCLESNGMAPEDAQTHQKAVALRGKGYVLIDMDKLGEAEAALRESLTIEPGNPLAMNELQYIAQQRANLGRGKS